MSARYVRSVRPRLVLLTLATLAVWACPVHAGPTVGFVEDFPAVAGAGSWGGGASVSNPGTGGYGGAGDGFLLVSTYTTPTPGGNLGTRSSGPEYVGDWIGAGVTQIRVWLNDVNAPDVLEIHASLGNVGEFPPSPPSFWQYNVGFIPPQGRWAEFVVDLTSANWTRTIGSGTITDAFHNVSKLHFRHDLEPYQGPPDPVFGDVGIDHILLSNGLVGVTPRSITVPEPVQLAPPSPNPSRGSVALALESSDTSPVHLQVVDAQGRSVRRAELAAGTSGLRIWTWDGADDRGRRVAPGYYRVRAWSAAGGTSRALIRVD